MRKIPKINYWSSLLDCFQECFGDVRQCDFITGYMDDGKPYRIYGRTFLKRVRKKHCWGFYNRNKNQINLWFDKKVHPIELIRLIAHELTHSLQKKNSLKSWREQDATRTEIIAGDSAGLMFNLFKLKLNREPSLKELREQIILKDLDKCKIHK